MALTVLMNAGPWLPLPPREYGGIEAVVSSLVVELRRRGVRVILATVGESTLEADGYVTVFDEGQFDQISTPYNRAMGIAHAHMQAVTNALGGDLGIDLVHDHLEVVGPSVLGAMGTSAPPTLQTLHWNLRKHPHFYESFDGRGRVFFVGVSPRQVELAPRRLRDQVLAAVPLGVPVADYAPPDGEQDKDDYMLTLARVTEDKGQDIAARLCREGDHELVMAGPLADVDSSYYSDRVQPFEDDRRRWIGAVAGEPKRELLRRARALLCPIRWEEPGGTAVIEALASGTPVIGFRRGCMPLLVEHGVTGFLAEDDAELAGYLDRVDEIDPLVCRAAAVKFSSAAMAERYLSLYDDLLERAA